MHFTTATMTTVLDTLERKGYIRRQPDLVGRRRVMIDITPDAQASSAGCSRKYSSWPPLP